MSIFNLDNETATVKSYLSGETETLVNRLSVVIDVSKREFRDSVNNFSGTSELARQKWIEHEKTEIGARVRRNLHSLTTTDAVIKALAQVDKKDIVSRQLLHEALEILELRNQ